MENNKGDIPVMEEATEDTEPVEVVEPEKIKEPIWEDRDTQSDPFTDVSKHTEADKGDYIMMPACEYDKLLSLVKSFTMIKNIDKEILLSKADLTAHGLAAKSSEKTLIENTFIDKLNSDPNAWVSNVNYGEMELGGRFVGLPHKPGTISGITAVAKFSSIIGIGDIVQMPLWHSGFWVTIKPATQTEIINLERAIASSEITAGRESNTLVYSNYSVIVNRILVDFIIGHITEASIKIAGDDSLVDHISVHDLQPLVLGIIIAMFPSGFEYLRPCKNTSVLLTETGEVPTPEILEAGEVRIKSKCNHLAKGRLDPKKLMKHNRQLITKSMREHMAKRIPNSVTVTECDFYRSLIRDMDDKQVSLISSNGTTVTLTLCIPTLRRYIDVGENWILRLIELGEELFSKADTASAKNEKVNSIITANMLGLYNTFIKSIEINGEIVSDENTINQTLEMFTNDDKLFDEILHEIKQYISLSPIAIPAIANYTCPDCKGDQNPAMAGTHFQELIPLNLIEIFFDLSALKMLKLKRDTY